MLSIEDMKIALERSFYMDLDAAVEEFDQFLTDKIYPQIDDLEMSLCEATHVMEEKWWDFCWSLPSRWRETEVELDEFIESLLLPEVTILDETEFSPADHIFSKEGYHHG